MYQIKGPEENPLCSFAFVFPDQNCVTNLCIVFEKPVSHIVQILINWSKLQEMTGRKNSGPFLDRMLWFCSFGMFLKFQEWKRKWVSEMWVSVRTVWSLVAANEMWGTCFYTKCMLLVRLCCFRKGTPSVWKDVEERCHHFFTFTGMLQICLIVFCFFFNWVVGFCLYCYSVWWQKSMKKKPRHKVFSL